MTKTVRCPNCGCEFEEELKDKGYTYTNVMSHIEKLLDEGQSINIEIISRQYGRPRIEVGEMRAKIRKKRTDQILRSVVQGQFKFLSQPEEIAAATDKRWRGITGQLRMYAQDKAKQVSLLEKSKKPESLQKATEIKKTYHIVGDLLPKPVRAKMLPSGLFEVIGGNGAKET
ncbi:unnamed protein product [marine sediment metagenome]|uniref:Uncharacterized protein n=1 Tax=marine sediment metagenome TaxID=412755 RepID=X1R9Q3_9ZZZZ